MTKRYEIANLSSAVQTFEGLMVQPRTRRVLELKGDLSDKSIERYNSRQVLIQETSRNAENDQPLPASDPKLVAAYASLSTAEGADREKLLADLGFGGTPAKSATTARKAE